MIFFDASREWVIILPSGILYSKKCAEDLSRCIGLLSGAAKMPPIIDSLAPAPSGAVITLDSDGGTSSGFFWRAGPERVEISGRSDRGLCSGIYSFLAALGISWPAPGEEILPKPAADLSPGQSAAFPLSPDRASESSDFTGDSPAAAPMRRYVPAGKEEIKKALKKPEAFAAWAARRRYDALVFPLAAYMSKRTRKKLAQLRQNAGEYGIVLEAGGRDLSTLLPRWYFLFHMELFRMQEGKRTKAHHFCITNPDTLKIVKEESEKFFRAAKTEMFHLWPDKGASWCSCPSCRAFTAQEQNLMAVNTAADALLKVNPNACITYYEKPGAIVNIAPRKNLYKLERLPDEEEISKEEK